MSTSPISSGSSTGFDVNSVVTGLMTIERQPLNKLNTKVTDYQAKITALGAFKSQVASLQSAAQSLGSTSSSSFLAFKATPSDTSVVSASATSTAVAGSYSLDVTSLAQSQKLVAAGRISSTAAISNGVATTVTFDFGTISGTTTNGIYDPGAGFVTNGSGTKNISIDGTNNTLEGLRDAINAAKIGATATIVNDGSGAAPYRLALSSDTTGVSQSLKITTSGGDGTINTLLAYDPAAAAGAGQNLTQTTAAQNAVFEVNGIPISKTSNTVTDAIQGVTFTLSKESTATLTIARDTAAVSDKVAGFVKAYNDLYTAMKNSSAYKSKSALEGDATLRTLQAQMHSIADSLVSGGTLTKHSDVGLSFQTNGTLTLDSAKLDSAMTTSFSDVAYLFNSATGYATQFDQWATSTLAAGGAIDNRTTSLNASIKNVNTQIDSLTLRLDRLQKQYTSQYSSLNVLLSKMSSISTYLTQQLK